MSFRALITSPIRFFSTQNFPPMTRQSYLQELKTVSTVYIAIALVEGAVIGILAKKVFHVSDYQLTFITAAPMFANLTSFIWEHIAFARPKVRLICQIFLTVLFCISLVAFLPISPIGRWALTGLIILIRCLVTGVVTLRSIIWRHNYPRHIRSRITGRTAIIVQLAMLLTPIACSLVMDIHESAFRIFYPFGALVAVAGVISFSKIRLRHEKALLKHESSSHRDRSIQSPSARVWPGARMITILKKDALFRRYLLWQFFAGVSNMMAEPVFIKIIAERTEGLQYEYIASTGIAQTLPVLVAMSVTPLWAHYLDRVHVARFRVIHSWFWCIAQTLIGIGVLYTGNIYVALGIFALARFIHGIARGGGILAWNLGHLDFASKELAAVYMGIHVTLTGIRGAIAPLIGMVLYTGWNPLIIKGNQYFPGFDGIGGYVFFIAASFGVLSAVGYYTLEKQMRKQGHTTHIE